MVWNPFRRNRNVTTDNAPTGVQEYYQSERGERMGIAWLIALMSLVITVLVVLLVFFGGRWLYRKITQRNKPSNTAPTSQTNTSNNNSNNNQGGEHSTPGSGNTGQGATPNPTPPTTGPSTTPATGDTGEIPRTGPETDE